MRGLIDIFYPVAYQFRDVLVQKVKAGQDEQNIIKWTSRAALELIGQGGFGYSFDALNEGKTNEYHEAVKMFG